MPFEYTNKQKQGYATLTDRTKREVLFDGGSRSGKTVLDARYYIIKSLKYPNTRRLICRKSKTSCINSVWTQTLIPSLQEFKGYWKEDATNHRIKFVNGSEIWSGGFDNAQHLDAILGQEWQDIWLNEATDASFDEFGRLRTRLNWNPALSDGKLSFLLDCNPKNPGHWIHKYFIEHKNPITRTPLSDNDVSKTARLWFHPIDNEKNLSPEYLESLKSLYGINYARFWEGKWVDNVVGQVFRFNREVNCVDYKLEYNPNLETWCSWDFGIAPSTTFIVWYQLIPVPVSAQNKLGCVVNIIDEYEDHDKDAAHYINIVKSKPYNNTNIRHAVDPAGNQRDSRLESWVYHMRTAGLDVKYVTSFNPHEQIDNANNILPHIRANENTTPRIVECLENWSYPLDKDGKVVVGALPNHDEYSHGGTSFYYFTTNRFNPKRSVIY